jgi:hypothetical protein
MIPIMPRGLAPQRSGDLSGVTVIDCSGCDRPTVFVRVPEGPPLCAGCTGESPEARESPRRCPVDETVLVLESRSNVNVDRCPECGGLWLDAGELDMVVSGTAALASTRSDRVADLLLDVLAGSRGRSSSDEHGGDAAAQQPDAGGANARTERRS